MMIRSRTWVFPALLGALSPSLAFPAEKLDAIVEKAHASKTDALLILQDDRVLREEYSTPSPERIQAWSVTKSMVSLAVGFLLDEGKLDTIDAPVWRWFPEWNQGKRKEITIRHLLSHTSGISTDYEDSYEYPDVVALALASEQAHDPGTVFEYNNKAVHLLSGVVQKIAGERTDLYLKRKLFDPLGIQDYDWELDQAGHAKGSYGLRITARELAKIGRMMMDRGRWAGQSLISESWVSQSTQPSQLLEPKCGLLWWLVNDGQVQGFNAAGYLGQYLVVLPQQRVIGVRLHRERADDDETAVSYFDFPKDLAGAFTEVP